MKKFFLFLLTAVCAATFMSCEGKEDPVKAAFEQFEQASNGMNAIVGDTQSAFDQYKNDPKQSRLIAECTDKLEGLKTRYEELKENVDKAFKDGSLVTKIGEYLKELADIIDAIKNLKTDFQSRLIPEVN